MCERLPWTQDAGWHSFVHHFSFGRRTAKPAQMAKAAQKRKGAGSIKPQKPSDAIMGSSTAAPPHAQEIISQLKDLFVIRALEPEGPSQDAQIAEAVAQTRLSPPWKNLKASPASAGGGVVRNLEPVLDEAGDGKRACRKKAKPKKTSESSGALTDADAVVAQEEAVTSSKSYQAPLVLELAVSKLKNVQDTIASGGPQARVRFDCERNSEAGLVRSVGKSHGIESSLKQFGFQSDHPVTVTPDLTTDVVMERLWANDRDAFERKIRDPNYLKTVESWLIIDGAHRTSICRALGIQNVFAQVDRMCLLISPRD